MGFKSSRVILILVAVFVVAVLLAGCNRSATKPEPTQEPVAEQESQETPVQTMVTPTTEAQPAEVTEPGGEPTDEPTEEAPPTAEPVEPTEPAPQPEPTAAPTEEATPAEPEPAEEQIYTVMPGDTLFSIALFYGVSVEDLAARNGIVNVNVLEVGQQLIIPVEGAAPPQAPVSGEQTYVVQAGDNLFRIALRYNMSFETVAAYNNIPWPYRIYVGQEIKIPAVP
jgi:LysM repeat protein